MEHLKKQNKEQGEQQESMNDQYKSSMPNMSQMNKFTKGASMPKVNMPKIR